MYIIVLFQLEERACISNTKAGQPQECTYCLSLCEITTVEWNVLKQYSPMLQTFLGTYLKLGSYFTSASFSFSIHYCSFPTPTYFVKLSCLLQYLYRDDIPHSISLFIQKKKTCFNRNFYFNNLHIKRTISKLSLCKIIIISRDLTRQRKSLVNFDAQRIKSLG